MLLSPPPFSTIAVLKKAAHAAAKGRGGDDAAAAPIVDQAGELGDLRRCCGAREIHAGVRYVSFSIVGLSSLQRIYFAIWVVVVERCFQFLGQPT